MCYEVKLKISEMGNLISKKSYTTDELGIISTVISLHYATFLSTPLFLRDFCFC
jgi:hypothetical protein